MATTFKVTVKKKRKDGLYSVYVRVTHNRQMAYLLTDKLTTDKYLSATKDVTDPYVLKSVNEKIVKWSEALNRVETERWTVHDVVKYIKSGAEEVSFSDYARTH
ncbi:MAG: phage integrase SAM-like domain-containing protein, partial [Prevotella sp.]